MQRLQWAIGTSCNGFRRISKDKFLQQVHADSITDDTFLRIYLLSQLPKLLQDKAREVRDESK